MKTNDKSCTEHQIGLVVVVEVVVEEGYLMVMLRSWSFCCHCQLCRFDFD
jgi:hypothetical protein